MPDWKGRLGRKLAIPDYNYDSGTKPKDEPQRFCAPAGPHECWVMAFWFAFIVLWVIAAVWLCLDTTIFRP
jgi:hypothetical protein